MKLFTIVLALTGLLCINADDHEELLEKVIKVMISAPPHMCAGIDGTQAAESMEQLATLVNSTAVQTALGQDASDTMGLIADANELLVVAGGIESLLQSSNDAEEFVDALVTSGYVNATDRDATLAAANATLGDFAEWRVHDILKMMLGESIMRQFRNEVDERLEKLMEHVTEQSLPQFRTICEDMMHTLCFLFGRFGDMHAAIDEVKKIVTSRVVKRIEEALDENEPEERQLTERRRRRAASASGEKQLFERRLFELIDRVRKNKENQLQSRQGPGGAGAGAGAENNCPGFDEDAVAEALKPKALAKALNKVENALEILRFVAGLSPERRSVLNKARCNYFDKATDFMKEALSLQPPPTPPPETKRAFMIL